MRSTFFGLNTALQALMAQRKAMEVSAHNVANANTEGFTRQEATMVASDPYTIPAATRAIEAGQMGTGVKVDSIRRLRDEFLDRQLRDQMGALGNWEVTQDYLEQIETILNEPSDSGISALMSKMWGAWHDLSANPDSYAAKAAVVENASTLTDALRRTAGYFDTLRAQASAEIDIEIVDVNSTLSKIADLNRQIQKVELVGDEANDLRDQRDLLLDGLSKTIPVQYEEQLNAAGVAELSITLDGEVLVDGGDFFELRTEVDSSTGMLVAKRDDGDGDLADDLALTTDSSKLGGLLWAYNHTLNLAAASTATSSGSLAWQLDRLASTMIDEVNQTYDPTGTQVILSGTGSLDIRVEASLVGNPSALRPGASGEAGDGALALTMARLETQPVDFDGDGVADSTMSERYRQLIASLGIDCHQAKGMASNQRLLVDRLKSNREAMSGVSLDEEAANMIRFERAYQAAARVMTAMDEMLDTLINGTGVVGR